VKYPTFILPGMSDLGLFYCGVENPSLSSGVDFGNDFLLLFSSQVVSGKLLSAQHDQQLSHRREQAAQGPWMGNN